MTGKFCTKCQKYRPVSEFHKSTRAGDGLQLWCKHCSTEASRARYKVRVADPEHVARRRAKWRELRAARQAAVAEYLDSHPCVDCGNDDILVLDFDHRDDSHKTADVGRLLSGGYSVETVMREIAKCDVRCTNCHRIRTAISRGSWRLAYRKLNT